MLTPPWDFILTILFALTGIWCAVDLARHRAALRGSDGAISRTAIIDVNHLVMSAAMILMIWISVVDAATWAQIAIFVIFAIALLVSLSSSEPAERISTLGHVVLNVAMIWMLAAMPLLMAGTHASGGESSGHHGGGTASSPPTSTPTWADIVNLLFVIASAAAAIWWIVRLIRSRGNHLHDVCYALMGAGMAIMLVVMNA
ncbi:DUF5134 domain-containing protein [Acaricomes phytoseiuli]|uniref:DUF5134 domain-containing protein n=1 Tax=Acaricomes phytoseiuli TaxID=291968 RepID=UPI002222E768|nr:DUF5134 domain-containing protein [Acaricomes phytoseiuli]MCW1250419.1 DUF5134 domain-containing protein [Acaricomes phytoseiuli]